MAVQMLGRLNRQWKHDMLRPVYTMRSIQSGSRLLWKHILLVCRMLFTLITRGLWCVLKGDPARLIGTFLFHILSVWKLENVCMCMSIELKADLMGSVAAELSHGSVTHHRTLGSHDSLIIWGIVWSLSIIKTNHCPAACCLSIIVCRADPLSSSSLCHSKSLSVCVCLYICLSLFVSLCHLSALSVSPFSPCLFVFFSDSF